MSNARRTKRRLAHELYPRPKDEFSTHTLDEAVKHFMAFAVGTAVAGTDWLDALKGDETRRVAVDRLALHMMTTRVALLLDAIHQEKTSEEAWEHVTPFGYDDGDITGEVLYARARNHGITIDNIKPYPVLAETGTHCHQGEPLVNGKESECEACTEPVEDGDPQ